MTFEADDTTEAHEKRVARCREPSCRAQIIWLPNPATGKNVPVDADTVKPDDVEYESGRHVSHFKTCTAPNKFSRGR